MVKRPNCVGSEQNVPVVSISKNELWVKWMIQLVNEKIDDGQNGVPNWNDTDSECALIGLDWMLPGNFILIGM